MIDTSQLIFDPNHIDPLRDDGFVIYKIGYIHPVTDDQRLASMLFGNVKNSSGIAEAPNDGKTYGRKNKAWSEDNAVKIAFDFITSDELFFRYKCPVALVFTSQEYESAPATITPPLNTNLNQYDVVDINVSGVGMIILNGHTL